MIHIHYTGTADENLVFDEKLRDELMEQITVSILEKITSSNFEFMAITFDHSKNLLQDKVIFTATINLSPEHHAIN